MYRLSKKLKNKVKQHALSSIYRLNAKTADCYAFSIIKEKKYLDFCGGWDWLNDLIDKEAQYIYDIKRDVFIKRG